MKAAVYYSNSKLEVKEFPKPVISEGEILIKVKASGICGSDLMEWYRKKKVGKVLGHEIAGDVVESKSSKFSVGDRVFVSHHVPCGECKYCKEENYTACDTLHKGNYDPGGFSEFVRVPALNVEKGTYLLGDLSYEEGAMIEPLACCIRAQKVMDIKKGHTVFVFGCGVSGLMNINVAKINGASVMATDVDNFRLEKAKEFGAEIAANISEEELTVKADRIIICTGAMSAVKSALECIEKKGKIMFFAIPPKNVEIPVVDFWRNEWTLASSYGAAPKDLEEAMELIKSGDVDVKSLITNEVSLDEIQEGFKIASSGGKNLKVVVLP